MSLTAKREILLEKLGREAHLWVVRPESIQNRMVLGACMESLSSQEREKYRRFRFAEDRHRYLVSHALVRNVLSKYAETLPGAWVFSQSDHGRPEVANPGLSALRFNLSHTSGLVICIVTSACDCGVDVEKVQIRHNPIGVAKRMFSNPEFEHMQQLSGRKQLDYFFTRWTLREAYTKARGMGITFPTHKLCFHIQSAGEVNIDFHADIHDKHEDWQLETFSLTEEHIAAVAIRRSDQNNKTIIRYSMKDDLKSYTQCK